MATLETLESGGVVHLVEKIKEYCKHNVGIIDGTDSDIILGDGTVKSISEFIIENIDIIREALGITITNDPTLSNIIGYSNSELDDFTVQNGSFYNQGAGWHTFVFPKSFEGVPQVFVSTENYHIEIKNITQDYFEYHVYEYKYNTPTINIVDNNISLHIPQQDIVLTPTKSGSYLTAVTAEPLPAMDVNVKTDGQKIESTTNSLTKSDINNGSVKIQYIAIEYGGE